MQHRCLAVLVALLLLFGASEARANGRMPGANDVAFDHGSAPHLLARATFGLVQSFDRGASWHWICEQAIDTNGVIADPPTAIVADGSTVLLPPTGGALVSRDRGCTWQKTPEPLTGKRGADLTLDPSDPARLLVLTSTIREVDPQGFGVYENQLIETRDSAQSWSLLATLPSDFEAETVEVAESDGQRIYVSGTASKNPRLGIVQRSEDGGAHWTQTTLDLPAGSGSLLISAIAPDDPDRLWLRVPARGDTLGVLPARLYLSDDKGASFRMLADTRRGMFGFALSPDGKELAYGGPSDGLYVGPSDGSGTFKKVSDLGVRCLRWPTPDALYACGSEPRDKFSLGVSRDKGASFEALYRMAETCPADCPEGSSAAGICQEAWEMIGPFVGASGAMCGPAQPAEDAGVADAGEEDAGAQDEPDAARDEPEEEDAGVTPRGGGGGGCSLAHLGLKGLVSGELGLLWMGLGLAIRRRLGRRRAA